MLEFITANLLGLAIGFVVHATILPIPLPFVSRWCKAGWEWVGKELGKL